MGSVDLTGVVRLSYAGAVLLFGFVADIKKRAYLPFMAACVLAGSTLMFAFLDSPETYSINAVLLYILSASSVVYLTVAFLDLAPRTAHPELWAGMGRVLRSFSVAATAVPFIRLYDAAGHAVMMAVAFAATVAVLVLFFADGQFSPGRAESAARARGVSGLAGFAEKYGLTPRETASSPPRCTTTRPPRRSPTTFRYPSASSSATSTPFTRRQAPRAAWD